MLRLYPLDDSLDSILVDTGKTPDTFRVGQSIEVNFKNGFRVTDVDSKDKRVQIQGTWYTPKRPSRRASADLLPVRLTRDGEAMRGIRLVPRSEYKGPTEEVNSWEASESVLDHGVAFTRLFQISHPFKSIVVQAEVFSKGKSIIVDYDTKYTIEEVNPVQKSVKIDGIWYWEQRPPNGVNLGFGKFL